MKATTYLLRYKDSKAAEVLNFGPFISQSIAEFFKAALPKPLEGGFVKVSPIQPFTAHEGRTVSQMILRNRKAAMV